MIYEIEKPPANTFHIDEEWGYRLYLWFDSTNSFDPNKDYGKLSGVSKRNFPGTLLDVETIIYRNPQTGEVCYYGDDSIKVNEDQLVNVVYIVNTDNGLKAYCGNGVKTIGVDVD